MDFFITKLLSVAVETLGALSIFFIAAYFIVKKNYSNKEILSTYFIVWVATTIVYCFKPQIKELLSTDIFTIVTLCLPILFLVATFQGMKLTRNK